MTRPNVLLFCVDQWTGLLAGCMGHDRILTPTRDQLAANGVLFPRAFWFCSFIGPHPPVTPPGDYLELYRHAGVDEPFVGDWARDFDALPYALKRHADKFSARRFSDTEIQLAREAFYAQCTYIDHQMCRG